MSTVHLHLFSPPILLLAAFTVQPLANPEVLEPSVVNEVEHAIARAPKELVPVRYAFTNGVTATDRAIHLASTQKADGRWYDGTNDVTFAAIIELHRLAGFELDEKMIKYAHSLLKAETNSVPVSVKR